MGILNSLFKPQKPVKVAAIFRRISTALDESTRHDPAIAVLQLSEADMEVFDKYGGRTSPYFPKKLQGVPVEASRSSVLKLADGSVITV